MSNYLPAGFIMGLIQGRIQGGPLRSKALHTELNLWRKVKLSKQNSLIHLQKLYVLLTRITFQKLGNPCHICYSASNSCVCERTISTLRRHHFEALWVTTD